MATRRSSRLARSERARRARWPRSPSRTDAPGLVGGGGWTFLTSLALGLVIWMSAAPTAAQTRAWSLRLPGPRAAHELRDDDPMVRMDAAERLGRIGHPRRAVDTLLGALPEEEHGLVREAIVLALARRGDARAVGPIAAASVSSEVALWALAAIGGDEALRKMVEMLPAPRAGEFVAPLLVRAGAPAVSHLIAALAVPGSLARAAHALGEIGDGRALGPLLAVEAGLEPAPRAQVLRALGRLGDRRAAPAAMSALEAPAPAVVIAALEALAEIGDPSHARAVAALSHEGAPEVRESAWRTWLRLEPEAASEVLLELTETDDPDEQVLVEHAMASALEHPHPAFVPLLVALGERHERAAEAADALARVPEGAGLTQLSAACTAGRPWACLPLAVGLHRYRDQIPGGLRARARRAIESREDTTLALRALAGLELGETIAVALDDASATRRADAALALSIAPGQIDAERIARAALRERDPDVFRALLDAAGRAGAILPIEALLRRARDPDLAPDALLAAASADDGSPARRRLGRALRRALRGPDPRGRALAALGLARAEETIAWRALMARVADSEEHAQVRRAAARALASLGVTEARAPARALARIERDDVVRAVLEGAGREGRRPPLSASARELVYARIRLTPGVEPGPLAFEIRLPDGRWIRRRALDDGLVLVPHLPTTEVDLQIRPARPEPSP